MDPLFSPPGNTRPPLDSNVAFSPAASAAFATACVQISNLAQLLDLKIWRAAALVTRTPAALG